MKKFLKIILIVLGIILVVVIIFIILLIWASKKPVVSSNYYENIETTMPLEQKYIKKGDYEVSYIDYESNNKKIEKIKIWYPKEMIDSNNTYPMVVMANGTGVKASRYEAIFDHLASWGFIVIGNQDESSWDGVSSSVSLDFMLEMNNDSNSIFYKKIDIDNIGVAGHSQGGVGVINAVTNQDNGYLYKAMYTASTTHVVLAEALKWTYDVSKVNIPYFMVAGTLSADAGDGKDNVGIAPLFSLQENYDNIDDSVEKIMARRVNADHGDMLTYADGYMTAWFMYQLKRDEDAKKVFKGEDAEILGNSNWQDVLKNR